MGFIPDEDPDFMEFLYHYPIIGPKGHLAPWDFNVYDLGWTAFHLGMLSGWQALTARGVSLNMMLGHIFFPTPGQAVGRHWHTSGGSPGFVQGVIRSPYFVPVSLLLGTYAVGRGYVKTSGTHGGAYSVPGGSVTYGPGVYGSDPMGEFRQGVRGFFSLFGF